MSKSNIQETSDSTQPVPLNESKPQRKPKSVFDLILILIIIILLLLLFKSCSNEKDSTLISPPQIEDTSSITDGELTVQTSEEIKASLQEQVDNSYMNLKININPIFQNSQSKGNLLIENSKLNNHATKVTIYTTDTSTTVYESALIKPNQSIVEDSLTVELPKGNHEAIALFQFIDEENQTVIGEAGMKILISILN